MPLPNNFDQDLAELARMKAALLMAVRPILRKPHHWRTPHERLALTMSRHIMAACNVYAMLARAEYYGYAMMLIRVQLDSCLRFFASTLVADPDRFTEKVLDKKKQVNEMHDRDGETMTGGYLARQLARRSPEYSWAPDLYKFASDFIHYSGTLMEIAEAEMAYWDETTELADIHLTDREIPKGRWEDSLRYFRACTLAFTRLLRDWLTTHDLNWP